MAGDAGHQHALADAGTGKDPHALAEPAGQQAVDGADAGADRLADGFAIQRQNRSAVDSAGFGGRHRAEAVDRPAESIEQSAQQFFGTADARGGGDILDAVAARDTGGGGEGHEERAIVAETDDLGGAAAAAEARDATEATEGKREANRFDGHAADGLDLADDAEGHGVFDGFELSGEAAFLQGGTRLRPDVYFLL